MILTIKVFQPRYAGVPTTERRNDWSPMIRAKPKSQSFTWTHIHAHICFTCTGNHTPISPALVITPVQQLLWRICNQSSVHIRTDHQKTETDFCYSTLVLRVES